MHEFGYLSVSNENGDLSKYRYQFLAKAGNTPWNGQRFIIRHTHMHCSLNLESPILLDEPTNSTQALSPTRI